jgi:hypothetical protein
MTQQEIIQAERNRTQIFYKSEPVGVNLFSFKYLNGIKYVTIKFLNFSDKFASVNINNLTI